MARKKRGAGSNPASQIKVAAEEIAGTGQAKHKAPTGVDRYYPPSIPKKEQAVLGGREKIRRKIDAIDDCCDLGYHLGEVWDDLPEEEEGAAA